MLQLLQFLVRKPVNVTSSPATLLLLYTVSLHMQSSPSSKQCCQVQPASISPKLQAHCNQQCGALVCV